MAPFREQFYDLVTGTAPLSHRRISLRHVPTAKLFKYSAFDNPNIPSLDTTPPRHQDEGDEEVMDESEDPDIDQPESPGPYPDLDYRERGQFPSDPDESSMEEGEHPSSGEQETESKPPDVSGGARPKIPARHPATKRKLPIGYYDGRVGPPPQAETGPRTRAQYADKGLEIPDDVWDPEATSKFYKDATKIGSKAKKTLGRLITPVRRPGKKPRKKSPEHSDF